MLTIAVCGNHTVPYCTERELDWTLEQMGHQVLRFQENQTTTDQMLQECRDKGAQLFIYIHTHGWITRGEIGMEELLSVLRHVGIKSCSFHLDRYWGLNGDKRESLVGQHPFWHTDVVFTADGGNDQRFAAAGIEHRWLPPAICARHCFRGRFDPRFAFDVVFVGAEGYHHEYPFRKHLITWLHQTYGGRFARFGNGSSMGVVREAPLNDLYASAKVVVGDSCFAGAPYYWSDRVPETLGRGGFLIHPATPGLQIDGLLTFPPGNTKALKECIDIALADADYRHQATEAAMADVRAHHTYHNRMQTLLEVMGLCT